jgi:hypothetical protein
MMSKLACILTLCLATTTPAHAAAPEPAQGFRFQIVTADDSAITRRIAEDLYKRLVPTFAVFRTELAQRRRMLYVAIGPAALREVAARRCDCVVISAFTSSQVFRSISANLPPARAGAVTAVYAEPAPADQLRLAALLYRRPVRVAAILGADTAFLAPALAADKVAVLQADKEAADKEGSDINQLLNRIAQTDVLLALPDAAVYNSEIEDINAQVAEIAAAYVAGGGLPAPQFPHYFRTIVNEGVARSLDVTVDDAARRFARPAPGHALTAKPAGKP